uniref:hypothetical protein n=1 Tax=Pseudomonas sp. RW407 TaxID=2202894 RepID=UPI001314ACC4|nr:hypothetical protein [Pseudomonas sp. RW407]
MLEIGLSEGLDRWLEFMKPDAESRIAEFVNDALVQFVMEVGTSRELCYGKQCWQTFGVCAVHW